MAQKSRMFIVRNEEASYEELPDGNIRAHSSQRSFKAVQQNKKKVIIYETFRKGREPVRRATYTGKKSVSLEKSISKYKDSPMSKRFTHSIRHGKRYDRAYYTNQRPHYSMQNVMQLQIVANVRDNKSGVADVYMGYSRKFKTFKHNNERLVIAEQQAEDMCIAKFASQHGISRSGDASVDVISRRWIVRHEI